MSTVTLLISVSFPGSELLPQQTVPSQILVEMSTDDGGQAHASAPQGSEE